MAPFHNERLEFLGDAIIEYLCSLHLFLMFPEHRDGQLASYRAALVQNKHLQQVARVSTPSVCPSSKYVRV